MADKVLNYESQIAAMSDEELKAKTDEFKERYNKGESLDSLLYEAFAVVREAAKRVLGLFPYKVQVMGGIVLHHGDVPEMRTGEGKTLTATMPVYLNALAGKGSRSYSQRIPNRTWRDWNGWIVLMARSVSRDQLGSKISNGEKKEAYLCDITYSTNSEIGFTTFVITWSFVQKHGATSTQLCLGRWGWLNFDRRSSYTIDRFVPTQLKQPTLPYGGPLREILGQGWLYHWRSV